MLRGVALRARASSVLGFESFADGLDILSARERDRVKIAGGEILDNIITHGFPAQRCRLRVRVRVRESSILLSFYFRAPGFAAFSEGHPDPEPLFDAAGRRWRGLGLVMCRNLATRIAFRPGRRLDRIFLEFARDGQPRPAGRAVFSVPLPHGNQG